MNTELVRAQVAAQGFVQRSAHPDLRPAIDWLVRSGELQAVLPGIYAPAQLEGRLLVAALAHWRPDCVVVGDAAAAILFDMVWPERIEIVDSVRTPSNPRVLVSRRKIDPMLVSAVEGIRVLHPAAAAVWCAAHDDGAAIDTALRKRLVTLGQLKWAAGLLGNRRGSAVWSQVVEDSRDNPWSPAERLAHRLLREAGIGGWRTNQWFELDGLKFPADIVFMAAKLVIEIDGYAFHSGREVFERDRAKANALVRAGWTVLRVTWQQLEEPGYLVRLVRDVLRRNP